MKPEVFLRAAKRVHAHPMCACDAIGHDKECEWMTGTPYHDFFSGLYEPEDAEQNQTWFGPVFGLQDVFRTPCWIGTPEAIAEAKGRRIFALLFAYEIAKDEFRED